MAKWYVGIDLGQVNDYTAVTVLEKLEVRPRKFGLRHLDRWRGETYPKTVQKICDLVTQPELAGCVLAIDQTGVGRAVFDMLKERMPAVTMHGITITSGSSATASGPGMYNVPKKDLVAMTQVLMQQGRLIIAKELPMVETLVQELVNFKVKVTVSANESFLGDWREGQHDDMVLALCMACWLGKNNNDWRDHELICSSEETEKIADELAGRRPVDEVYTLKVPGIGSLKVEFPPDRDWRR